MRTNNFILRRTLSSLVLLILFTIFLAGCWSSHEINNLAIIGIMGIDQDDSGQFEVTVSIINPSSGGLSAGTGKVQSKALVETAVGTTLFEAIEKISSTLSKEIYLGNLGIVIVGEKAAQNKMECILEFLKRNTYIRPYVQLLITRENVIDIVKSEPQLKSNESAEIEGIIKNRRYAQLSVIRDVSQFLKDFSTDTKDSFTGEVHLAAKRGIVIAQKTEQLEKRAARKDNYGQEQKERALSLQGAAIFKDKKYIGSFNRPETRGLLLLRGELKHDMIVINCPEDRKKSISILINRSKSKLSPHFIEGQPIMDITIKVDGDIQEIACPDLQVNSNQINELNAVLEEEIRQEIMTVLDKAQKQWQADVFGFGSAIYHQYPKEWKQMAAQWRNGGLAKMKVNLTIIANISRSGVSKNPVKANESR